MDRIILDQSLREKLNGLDQTVEVCDESGRTVGHFVPDAAYRTLVYAWANAQVTDEELERLSQEGGRGRPLAEIWKSLGQA